jgi:hypothetical protein
VNPDEDTSLTVPLEPPAAGPDRALEPDPVPLWGKAVVVVVPPPVVAATIPYDPPPIMMAAMLAAANLDRLLENIVLLLSKKPLPDSYGKGT